MPRPRWSNSAPRSRSARRIWPRRTPISAEVLLKLDRREDAKAQALLALKQAPTFARAQDLLLAAMGRQ